MRRIVSFCATLLFVPCLAEPPAHSLRVAWESDYEQGMKKAKTEDRPVLIDFGAEWCGWCKKQDEEVFTDTEVVMALREFVCIKVDVDRNLDLAVAYHVRSLPRQIVVNVHGQVVGDQTGFLPVDAFLDFLRGVGGDLRRKTNGETIPVVRAADRKETHGPSIIEMDFESTETARLIELVGDPDPAVRERVGSALVHRTDAAAVLVRALGDDYLGTRIAAFSLLKQMGAPDLSFDPWATSEQRIADLDKWQAWLGQHELPAEAADQPSP